MLHGFGFRFNSFLVRQVPGNQPIQVVTVWPISAERVFIKQALDAATQADLVGVLLQADRPAHLAMPATAKNHQSSPCQPGSHHA